MDLLQKEVRSGNIQKVKDLLNENAVVQDSDWMDYKLLKSAIRFGQVEIAKLFIEKGFRVNRKPRTFVEDTPLHLAIAKNSAEVIKNLLCKNASLDAKNKNKETPLTLAARFDKLNIVDLIIPKISLENHSNLENLTHMHIACMRNQTEIVRKFLQNGAGINHQTDIKSNRWAGYTSLHFAVEYQNLETVQLLLDNGASIIVKDSGERTALHLAFSIQNEKIIDSILSAHIYESENPSTWQNLSHFHIACTRNNTRIVESFLQYKDARSLREIFRVVSYESLNWLGYTPLHFAVENECIDVVRLLLNYDIDIASMDDYQTTPIHLAHRTGNMEIINLLTTTCDRKRAKRIVKDEKDVHILISGCMKDDIESVEELSSTVNINHVIGKNSSCFPGWTALHIAVKYGSIEIIELLIQKGVNIDCKDFKGSTALHYAYKNNRLDIVDFLLKEFVKSKKSDEKNPSDKEGLSFFHISCLRGDINIIKFFINSKVNINLPVDFDSVYHPGFTPLHFSIHNKHHNAVELLLKHEADITARDAMGLTPFDVAVKLNSEEFDYQKSRVEIEYKIMESLLLERKRRYADPAIDRGFTLLHMACISNDMDSFERHLNEQNINRTTDYDLPRWAGYTPLHFATYVGNEEAITSLVNFDGCDVSIKNLDDNTPAHVSWNSYRRFHTRLVDGKILKCESNIFNSQGVSLFHIACARNDLSMVSYFLDRGVDVNKPTSFEGDQKHLSGKSPLNLASKKTVIELLLKHGAKADARDVHLRTPLHDYHRVLDSKVIDLFVDAGADINAIDEHKHTPLLALIDRLEFVHSNDVIAFLDNGADINMESREGRTPLTVNVVAFDDSPRAMVALMKHMMKLQLIDHYVSGKNELIYKAEVRDLEVNGYYNEKEFVKVCEREIQVLNETKIDKYTSLFDVINRSPNYIYRHINNETLKGIVYSDNLKAKYPIYGYLLRLQWKKGLARNDLLEPAKESLAVLSSRELCNVCSEEIIIHLSDYDLENLIKCTSDILARTRLKPQS